MIFLSSITRNALQWNRCHHFDQGKKGESRDDEVRVYRCYLPFAFFSMMLITCFEHDCGLKLQYKHQYIRLARNKESVRIGT